ncbi:dimethyl sulfoxide reductase anchor subunit family protein [Dongia sedimenti]|uniref:DmsC/YnfH family molybdoenzyme membrane anchor subunit n=1 Tax=Dongia sedimenti TaxID=3064282 RepID=A0ABU0YUS8_9PROT|nr:DmsC/YnfH family molybdoenzyme membrane anchor subunit [Rhodospirillaceae bacterium R-7]
MHPAYSVIFFTSASGGGYLLLALLALFGALGILPTDPVLGVVGFGVGFVAVTAGLLASTFHLGHPERAWRAFSQWRSSWLSREGVLSLATFVPAGLLAILWVFFGRTSMPLAILTILLALATVSATAMIYASLKPVQRWANGYVLPNYLLLGLASGATWLALITAIVLPAFYATIVLDWTAIIALGLAALGKVAYWRFIDRSRSASTPESATGLGAIGKVRLFAAPHTEENYLLKEMGYQVARKHALKLRLIALALGFTVPAILVFLAMLVSGWAAVALLALATIGNAIGTLTERWLFFAEARHTVTLYYGSEAA